MKKMLLLTGAVLLSAIPSVASPDTHSQAMRKAFKLFSPRKNAGKASIPNRLPSKAAEEGQWVAQHESMFIWEGQWLHAEDNDLTFNSHGDILTQFTTEFEGDYIVGYTLTTNEYNENGMVKERLIEASENGVDFQPSDRRVVEYDPILTSVITSNIQTVWLDGEEVNGNSYHFDITRDNAGNITLAERAVLFNGIFDPTERFSVEYGDDGKATSASESQLMYDYGSGEYYWQTLTTLSDIVWEETNGQIYCLDSMMEGDNRIKTAEMYDEESGLAFLLDMEYSEDGGYTMTMSSEDMLGMITKMTYTPLPNGGYDMVMTEEYAGTVILTIHETAQYDHNGLIVREYMSEEGYGLSYVEESAGEFFGEDMDKPEAYEYSLYDSDSEEWIPYMRIEFSDYTLLSGLSAVERIEATTSDSQPEYFNLQGIRIQEPTKGAICIERRGDKTRKILAR